MLTDERLAGMRKCADSFEVSLYEVTCSGIKIPYGIALDAAYCLSAALAEIERLSAQRPSCETCKWTEPSGHLGLSFCAVSRRYFKPGEKDGVCLWEAK